MLPDRVSKPGPLTYESAALQIALCSPASNMIGVAHLRFNRAISLSTRKNFSEQIQAQLDPHGIISCILMHI